MDTELDRMLKSKKKLNRIFVWSMVSLELILLTVMAYVISSIPEGRDGLYASLSMCIVIIWIMVMVGYLAWAIFFYNINMGLTNQDWYHIRKDKEAGRPYSEPKRNPFSKETLGLPPGTVRGLMAISLLVGAFSTMVAALGFDSKMESNTFFVDNFEFFKTAFLMMIAFYFGEKSLKHFDNKKSQSTKNTSTVKVETEMDMDGLDTTDAMKDDDDEENDDN